MQDFSAPFGPLGTENDHEMAIRKPFVPPLGTEMIAPQEKLSHYREMAIRTDMLRLAHNPSRLAEKIVADAEIYFNFIVKGATNE